MKRVKLNVLGLSSSHSQSGAYALILQEETTQARIPIVIGATEAQAIAIALEGLKPPRPLTHDLFFNLSEAYNISLLEVEINKLEEGVFYSQLVFMGDAGKIQMDARTSDAVALAIRFGAPIYTNANILEKAGIVMEDDEEEKSSIKKPTAISKVSKEKRIKNIEKELKAAIDREDYEEASRLKIAISELLNSPE